MKKCSKCDTEKSLDDFHNNRSKKDGKATECKSCKKKQDIQYRLSNLEECKGYQSKYWKDNRKELGVKKMEYIANNKSAHLKRQHSWYERNKADIKERTAQYKKDHPEKYQMYNSRRRAQKKTSLIENFDMLDVLNKYGNQCFYCQGKFDHIDHYIPLSKGGSHTLDNVRPSCEKCNLEKSNKLPKEFLEYKGISNEQ